MTSNNQTIKGSGQRIQIKKNNKQKQVKKQENEIKVIKQEKSNTKDQDKGNKLSKSEEKDKKQLDKKEKKKKKKQKGQKQQEAPQKQKSKKDKDKDKKGKQKEKEKEDKKEKSKNKDKKGKKSKQEQSEPFIQRIDKQQQTITNINNSKMTIQDLIAQYKVDAQKILFHNNGHDPQKQQKIQKYLQSLKEKKQRRHKRLQQLEAQKEQIQKSKQQQKRIKKQLRKQKIKEKKMAKIQQKLGSLEINASQRKRDYQIFVQYVKQKKKVKPRFKKYQEQFAQKLGQQKQEYKQKLQEHIRIYEPIAKETLDNFQAKYLNLKQQAIEYRKNKLQLQDQVIKQKNEKFNNFLWKGEAYQKSVEQDKNPLQEKRSKLQGRLEAMNQYAKMVRSNIKKPEVEQPQKPEEQSTMIKSNVRYRQKYLKGVNYGLVPQQKTLPLLMEEKALLGNSYLQKIKQINKQHRNKTVDYTNTITNSNVQTARKLSQSQNIKKESKTFKLKKKTNPYYPSESLKKQIDFTNYQAIQSSIQKLSSIKKDRQLNDQIIKHIQCKDIVEMQERKKKGGDIAVREINQKLNFLTKL